MILKKTIAVLALFLMIVGAAPARAEVVTISVAGSMTDVFKKLAAEFENTHPETEVRLNFASSGALAKQISQGAPADIFISANVTWMDYLAEKGLIDRASRRVFAENNLVFVGDKKTAVSSMNDLKRLDRIALGSPASVPAGQYAKQAMESAGIYNMLSAQNRFVMAKDVRQALMYADRGEADGAFVYRTDALLAEKAVILFTVPAALYPRIVYPLALTRKGQTNPSAQKFFKFLDSEPAQVIVGTFGFKAPVAP